MAGFDQRRSPHESGSENDGEKQSAAIVRMELDFRQEIGQGDADESAGTEGQGVARKRSLELGREGGFAQEEKAGPQRDQQGK